ncbi:MAG: gamma-glutamylcyclotransferase, partial [Alphaproteobacteria bacterium]|nr:gamma-glutamylcyclotransferase [Alphaproteobacteria bacterium]
PGWRYRPIWLAAEDSGGSPIDAVTFVADGKATDGNPSLRYITLLRNGARAHGLPGHWIAYLDGIAHAE